MNCQVAQNRILALADPRAITGVVSEHVAGCSKCQVWHQLLIRVENSVPLIPVLADSGRAKAELLKQFQTKTPIKKRNEPAPNVAAKPAKPKQSFPRKPLGDRIARLWPMGAVAAIAVVVVVLWNLSDKKNTPEVAAHVPDPLLDRVVLAKVQLDVAKTPPERLKLLAKLADDVQEQAKNLYLVSPGDEMVSLSKMYADIVSEGLMFQAEALDQSQRKQLLSEYSERLAKAEQQAERLAAEAPVGSDEPLREIAKIAREGRTRLAQLREKSL